MILHINKGSPQKKSLDLQILPTSCRGASVLLLQQEIPEKINLAAAEVRVQNQLLGFWLKNVDLSIDVRTKLEFYQVLLEF